MKKKFKNRLYRLLILGTIIPIICYVIIFYAKYYNINIQSERDITKNEISLFEIEIEESLNYYEGLLRNSLKFMGDEELLSNEKVKKEYLDKLLFSISGLKEYYYITNENKIVSSLSSSKTLNDKTVAFIRLSDDGGYWISKLDRFNDQKLYFGYGSPFKSEKNGMLVFEIDVNILFKDLTDIFDASNLSYIILFEHEEVISKRYDDFGKIKFSPAVTGYTKGDEEYLAVEKKLSVPHFSYIFLKNISREILFMKEKIVSFISLILVYFILLMIILRKFSKKLTSPLDLLIKLVSSSSEEKTEIIDLNTISYEYKEIFKLFNEMVESAYENIEEIEKQSKNIKEKNQIMEELNNQLRDSLDQIENSTRELQYLKRRSKALVDNIKDLMWVIDSKGRITFINKVVEDKLGYGVKELIGVKLENLLKKCIKNEESYQDIFYEDFENIDLVFIKKNNDNEEIYSASTKRIFVNNQLVQIQGVCRDITEERFIEEQMLQKKEISNTLNEISEILTKPEKLEVLLDHIVVRIERLLDPLVCTIRLINEDGRLELKAGIGECYTLIQEKYLDIDKDISGKAITDGKIIIVSKKQENHYENYNEIYTIVDRAKEMIFLPLEYDGSILGVMSIGLREVLSDVNIKILQVFTNQASAAIEKAKMYSELKNNYMNIIKALVSTVEAKDAYTEGHSMRVSKYSRMIAEELGLSDEEISYIDIAGLLHDIGKIGVSDLTLTKKGKLTDDEFREIKNHPVNGGSIVSEMQLHHHIIDGVLLHHKRFDLKGYPGILIDELPLAARIIGVADAFDAMTTNRSYQLARTYDEALCELENNVGTQFCPEIVKIMKRVIKTNANIERETTEYTS